MKKRKNLIFILALLLFPINVYALTGNVTISCGNKDVKPGETVSCSVAGTSDEVVGAIQGKITVTGNGVTINSFTKDAAWESGELQADKTTFSVSHSNSTIKDNFNIGQITLNVASDANSGDISISMSNLTTGFSSNTATFKVAADVKPVEKGLKSLIVNGGILSPSFSQSFTAGNVELGEDTSSFAIVATANNENDKIVCKNADDNTELSCDNITFKTSGGKDSMIVQIVVGEGENSVSYTLIIFKKVKETIGDPELKTLTIGGKQVQLVSGKIDGYEVTLANLSNYLVEWTLKDDKNYKVVTFNNNPTTHSGEYVSIVIEPVNSSSGLKSVAYSIKVNKAGGDNTTPGTQQPEQNPSNQNPSTGNPQTGDTIASVVAVILLLSFGVSMFLYQKNINGYN